MNLTLTKKGIFKPLRFFFIATLYTVFLIILMWTSGYSGMVVFLFWVVTCFPTLILLFQYVKNEKDRVIIIENNKIIVYCKLEEKKVYFFKDINKIILCRSAIMDNGGFIRLLPHESLSYFEIIFNHDSNNVIITNLLEYNLDDVLILFKEYITIEREYSSFCRLPASR